MRQVLVFGLMGLVCSIAGSQPGAGQPFPSRGSPNPALAGAPSPQTPPDAPPETPAIVSRPAPVPPAAAARPAAEPLPAPIGAATGASIVPRAARVARTTTVPACTLFVDASAGAQGDGTVRRPFRTIAAAIAAAAPGAIICVAEGVYPEKLVAGDKPFTLAGGFQRGKDFNLRDSASFVTKAQGRGGVFLMFSDPAPKKDQLNAVDGFEITGYSQAIVRDIYYSQRFDVTNNHIHDNRCEGKDTVGSGFALNNISGRIAGNVIRNNACARGGAGFLNDSARENSVVIERNLIENNAGNEADKTAHGGGLYLFSTAIRITGNHFAGNTVTGWGAGLYVGADAGSKQRTVATLEWNVYRGNRAGVAGGGLFCDDAATCNSAHEIFVANCGGNVYLDSSSIRGAATLAKFDHMTNVGALGIDCKEPGPGVRIDRDSDAPDTYSIANSLFWANGEGQDLAASCSRSCTVGRVDVAHSMVQTAYVNNGFAVRFGDGITKPADPLFADPDNLDFHLASAAGRWTPAGYVRDAASSPALAKASPQAPADRNPERAGRRSELGAYGNSAEASLLR